jgi:hypothetical protein
MWEGGREIKKGLQGCVGKRSYDHKFLSSYRHIGYFGSISSSKWARRGWIVVELMKNTR